MNKMNSVANGHRFITSVPLKPGRRQISLDAEEAQHAVRVLRVKEGDLVEVCDGKGGVVKGVVEQINRKERSVQVCRICESD